ncbi:hypothetical protein HID58_008648 [Brassica napus]|uniref:(rape) hypothetical protein n=1 Tax=Brassica napus TaxID=3708 RepID=A0A816W059_BRANA|nr:hypothetical protein HID58_008648 [Brassica napus]CAF2119672.1 unnamed protein product [Brassica napus]
MFFPKSGLEKIEFSSSSAEEPNHFVIDLEEETDIVNDPAAHFNPCVTQGSRKAYAIKAATERKIVVKIDIPGCTKLDKFDIHLNKVRFTATEVQPGAVGLSFKFAAREYDGSILFKYKAYENNDITYNITYGVLRVTFSSTN